jgi:type III pantothenate kinase
MNLLVDIGNSYFKWCFTNGVKIDDAQSFQYSKDNLDSLLTSTILTDKEFIVIEDVFVCSVASPATKSIFTIWLKINCSKDPIFVESSTETLGVQNAYKIASNLGNDRWLSLIYVHHFYKTDVCVIDCGTAITIDVILESGQHEGGLIAPGYMAQISALQLKTGIIDNHNLINQKKNPILQKDTDLCVEQGCRLMTLGFIKDVVNQLIKQYGDTLQVVITGGDSKNLAPDLPKDWDYQQDLLFKGLQFYSKQKSELDLV